MMLRYTMEHGAAADAIEPPWMPQSRVASSPRRVQARSEGGDYCGVWRCGRQGPESAEAPPALHDAQGEVCTFRASELS